MMTLNGKFTIGMTFLRRQGSTIWANCKFKWYLFLRGKAACRDGRWCAFEDLKCETMKNLFRRQDVSPDCGAIEVSWRDAPPEEVPGASQSPDPTVPSVTSAL
jgi:hypothetical protein